MATTRSLGTTMTPTFASPITLHAAGDDLNSQYLRYAGSGSSLATLLGASAKADAVDMTIKTNHRPLGQRGSHRPVVQVRAQFVQEDGRVATIALKTEIVIENGMTALMTNTQASQRSADLSHLVKYIRAMNAMAQNALLNPTGVENPDIEANLAALVNGIILVGA